MLHLSILLNEMLRKSGRILLPRKIKKEEKKKNNISKWFHSFDRISFDLECNAGNSLRRRVFA